MKFSMRLRYMGSAFVDVVRTIGKFLLRIGVPVVAVIGFIALLNYIPWWGALLVACGMFLFMYLWIRADIQYKEDHETSKTVLHDKYYEITNIWHKMMSEGKSCQTIYGLMTHMIYEYDMLLEYHKKLYGEDDTYKLYVNRVTKYIKACEEDEKNRQKRQEERAADLKAMGGNGEIEEGILI